MSQIERRQRKRERKNPNPNNKFCVYDESTKDMNLHAKKVMPQLLPYFSKERIMDIAEQLYFNRSRTLKNTNLQNKPIGISTIDGYLVTEDNLKIEVTKM